MNTKQKPRDRQVPGDSDSYKKYIESLSRTINRLGTKHLKKDKHSRDFRARQRLERLIKARAAALNNPPATIDSKIVTQMKEQIRAQH